MKFKVRDKRNGEWLWIQKCVIECWSKFIKPEGITIYCLLANFDFSKNHPGIVYPSQTAMSKRLGWSRSRVNRWIKVLVQNGLIGIDKRKKHYLVYILNKVKCPNNPDGIHKIRPSRCFTGATGCFTATTEMSYQRNQDVSPADTNKNKEKEERRITINNKIKILKKMRKELSQKLGWKYKNNE